MEKLANGVMTDDYRSDAIIKHILYLKEAKHFVQPVKIPFREMTLSVQLTHCML